MFALEGLKKDEISQNNWLISCFYLQLGNSGDFFDSELCKFDDFYIAVPKKYNDFLVKEYGKNWHIHKKTLLSEHYGMYDVKI
ncbi:hypothetical protein MALH04_00485 [Mycoplasma anatis]|uniref:hypothetical protein n=1 Tax=Mycoplasmopsis anatis TaxID=171279 RepID=UPI001C4E22A7|nr:hypothetical protein [Mycoplasmopsis anatis]MBW0594729.1 hypothetical protein [Mycoplasmopsis anatis]MBW0599053.1 hypothetical protein [Mycoplasmopsis anatis]MBW0601108.1 hypothetical protein [Mycoplasmopsis anatis]